MLGRASTFSRWQRYPTGDLRDGITRTYYPPAAG